MNFIEVKDKNVWKELLGRTLFKTFFHEPEWENFLEKEFSWIKFGHYIWKNGLLLSIARCKLLGKEKLISHPLCEYGGPMPLKEEFDLNSFFEDFTREFGTNARIQFHSYILRFANRPPLNLPLVRGDKVTRSTFIVEDFSKKTRKDLWSSFRKTLRSEINKSERHNIDISECETENELKEFYNLYTKTIKRHKTVPLPYSAFKFFNKIYLAKLNGRIIGGSVFLFYSPFIHYFINASDYKFRGLNIGHRILWHAMQNYAGKEYDYFDLGGTRSGSALEIFKTGWGAKKYSIYELGKYGPNQIAGWKRKAWGLLPICAIKKLSRYAFYWAI